VALQYNGAISLNDIHVEAGGSTGTQASINDADIRALIGKASGATMSFSEWYGATGAQFFTVTEGSATSAYYSTYGFTNGGHGSISPSSYQNSSGLNRGVMGLYRLTASSGTFFYLLLSSSLANSIPDNDFSSIQMVCNGTTTTLTSAEAATTFVAGGYQKRWEWSSSNGLDSTELSNITSEWNGSGSVTVEITQ
jgi:hypothetical protein